MLWIETGASKQEKESLENCNPTTGKKKKKRKEKKKEIRASIKLK